MSTERSRAELHPRNRLPSVAEKLPYVPFLSASFRRSAAMRLLTIGLPHRTRPSTGLSATGLKAPAPLAARARMALPYLIDMCSFVS